MPSAAELIFRHTLGRSGARLWPYRLRTWLRPEDHRASHSQHGEDVVIAQLINPRSARYVVDVGAHDGRSWSNSYSFLEAGFGGLLVEPIPQYAEVCRYHHKWNPRVSVEEKAILDREGCTTFYLTDDAENDLLAMTSSVRREKVVAESVREIEVACCPLETLLRKHDVPRDYALLNVDAEGVDLEVLQTAALAIWRPSVICVEFGCNRAALHDFLAVHAYRLHDDLGINGIYVRADGPA